MPLRHTCRKTKILFIQLWCMNGDPTTRDRRSVICQAHDNHFLYCWKQPHKKIKFGWPCWNHGKARDIIFGIARMQHDKSRVLYEHGQGQHAVARVKNNALCRTWPWGFPMAFHTIRLNKDLNLTWLRVSWVSWPCSQPAMPFQYFAGI